MKLGIGTYTYGWSFDESAGPPLMTETDLIDKAVAFDLQLVQIGDNLPLHSFVEYRLSKLQESLEKHTIKVEIGAKGLTHEHLQQYIHLCRRFNAHTLRFIIDSGDYRPAIGDIVAIIKAVTQDLESHHISLAIENHDRLKAKDYRSIVEQVNSKNVGICLDTVNSMGAGEGWETAIDVLAPFTLNLHIKDFGISRLPHKQGFVIDGRIAGQGMLDVSYLLDQLQQYGKCRTAIVEQWVPFEKDIKHTAMKEQEWAVESVRYLKKLMNGHTDHTQSKK